MFLMPLGPRGAASSAGQHDQGNEAGAARWGGPGGQHDQGNEAGTPGMGRWMGSFVHVLSSNLV